MSTGRGGLAMFDRKKDLLLTSSSHMLSTSGLAELRVSKSNPIQRFLSDIERILGEREVMDDK